MFAQALIAEAPLSTMLGKEATDLIRKRHRSVSRHLAMIVTSTYRYKRPQRKRKPVAIETPAIVTIDPKTRRAKKSHRPDRERAAAKMKGPRASAGEAQSTTAGQRAGRDRSVTPQLANDDGPRKSAIVTARKPRSWRSMIRPNALALGDFPEQSYVGRTAALATELKVSAKGSETMKRTAKATSAAVCVFTGWTGTALAQAVPAGFYYSFHSAAQAAVPRSIGTSPSA